MMNANINKKEKLLSILIVVAIIGIIASSGCINEEKPGKCPECVCVNKINVSPYVDGSYKDSKLVDNMKEVFYDDFNWISWSASSWDRCGSPLPSIHATSGNPSPSFRSNGDSWCHSGAQSKVKFNYSNGLIVEADSFMAVNAYGRHYHDWVLDVGSPNVICSDGDDVCNGDCGVGSSKAIAMVWIVGGTSNKIIYQIVTADGNIENHIEPYTKWGKWHTYRIYIRPDRKVEFYEDNVLKWISTQKIIQYNDTVPVRIGGRSDIYDVFHDNVKVFE